MYDSFCGVKLMELGTPNIEDTNNLCACLVGEDNNINNNKTKGMIMIIIYPLECL